MRIISGDFKGLKLNEPKNKKIRPTTDKVKEAIFDSLQFEIANKTFLDLFSGSGQMGIEALSRKADFVAFVDESLESINLLKSNISKLGSSVKSKFSIVNKSALDFLKLNKTEFNFVFMDPPYHRGVLSELILKVTNHICPNGTLICEHESKLRLPEKTKDLIILKNKCYGAISINY